MIRIIPLALILTLPTHAWTSDLPDPMLAQVAINSFVTQANIYQAV
jgi:hypothetical protein